jgi:hypothetical protein
VSPAASARRRTPSMPFTGSQFVRWLVPGSRNTLETAQEREQPFRILERRRCALCSGKSSEEPYQVLADSNVHPLCVHRLRYQAARTIMAEHRRQWRNGRTSTERYSVALRSTKEQIIPPPLNTPAALAYLSHCRWWWARRAGGFGGGAGSARTDWFDMESAHAVVAKRAPRSGRQQCRPPGRLIG